MYRSILAVVVMTLMGCAGGQVQKTAADALVALHKGDFALKLAEPLLLAASQSDYDACGIRTETAARDACRAEASQRWEPVLNAIEAHRVACEALPGLCEPSIGDPNDKPAPSQP